MKQLILTLISFLLYITVNSQTIIEFDTYHPDNSVNQIVTDQQALLDNNNYLITVSGTFSLWAPDYWSNPCGNYENSPITPSTSGSQTGKVSHDFGFNFGLPNSYWCNQYSNFPRSVEPFTISIDGGTTWFTPLLNEGYNSEHTYTFNIIGSDYPLKIKGYDAYSSDNYGILYFEIESTDLAICSIPTGISHQLVPPARCNITWDAIPEVQKYDVHYRIKDEFPVVWTRVTSFNNIRSLHYLAPNTVYQYFVRPYCNGSWDFANKSAFHEFNTANIPQPKLENLTIDKPFKVFPNPASQFITITNFNKGEKQGIIYNIEGKKVKTFIINNDAEIKLEINQLNSGIYIIKIGDQHQKLIIKNPIFS